MNKRRDLRMIWNSNAVFGNSGYGVHQCDLLYRLLADGWPVAQIAFYGLEGYPIPLDGSFYKKEWEGLKLKIYPKMVDTWGSDAMVYHSLDYQANAVFTMQDIWPLDSNYLAK